MSQSDPISVALKQIREVPEGYSLEHVRAELSVAQHAALAVLCQGANR